MYAYRWLLEEKKYQPSQIVVAGDSAGGGLALALCLYAKDHGAAASCGHYHDVAVDGCKSERGIV